MSTTISVDTISQIHEALGLPKPMHPLVSVVRSKDVTQSPNVKGLKVVINLYQVGFKKDGCGELTYGRNTYDYQEGTLIFVAPGQVMEMSGEAGNASETLEDWTLCFHPDLIRSSELTDKMDSYSFFSYDSNEALHLSDRERKTIEDLNVKIEDEYSLNLDRHSQTLIISNIELVLDYCLRFYGSQFISRANLNSDAVSKFERLLKQYYKSERVVELGVPTVSYCAKELGLSSNYLSDMLKKETGKTAQAHIHLHIVDKAKNRLLNSSNSISEIGYDLGFEYPQHFSNLFKSKTGFSPKEYRSLN